MVPQDRIVVALPETSRQSLSPLLSDDLIRKRPFHQPLNEPLSDIDQLLFALQISRGMQFLTDTGVSQQWNEVASKYMYL